MSRRRSRGLTATQSCVVFIAFAVLMVVLAFALGYGWINALVGGIHPRAALLPEALFPLFLSLAVFVLVRKPRDFVHELSRGHSRIVRGLVLALMPVLLGVMGWLTALFVIDVVGPIATEDVVVTRTFPRGRWADRFVTLDGRRFEAVLGGRVPLGPARIHVGASGRVLHAAALRRR